MAMHARTVREPAAYRRRRRRGRGEHPVLRAARRGAAFARRQVPAGLLALSAAILVAAVYLGGIAAAKALLDSEETIPHADVMIVLGGDGPSRAAHAADLWLEGRAHRIIVSGSGDCTYIAGAMIAKAVSPYVITIECRSGSTWQNAEFSAAILSRMKPETAIVVTNYFHERRALLSFRHFCPGVTFAPASVPPVSFRETVFGVYGRAITKEYLKLAVYAVRARLASIFGNMRPANGGVCIDTDSDR